jgi:hypothetical protein
MSFSGTRPGVLKNEDVILKKMAFYRDGGSEKHLRDIAGILKISSGGIDLAYIGDWAKKLGLEEIWASFSKPR